MRRTITAGVTLALVLGLALSGCDGDDPAATSTPSATATAMITVWVDENQESAFAPLAEEFEQDTGIAVNLVVKDDSELVDDFAAQAASGSGPDAIIAPNDAVGSLAADGLISPIDLGEATANFQDAAVEAFTVDDELYGVPYAVENLALIRNTDLAAEAPATWDDVLAAGDAAGTPLPILIGGTDSSAASAYNLYPFQQSFGASAFEVADDGSYDPTRLAMGGENGRAFAEWLDAQAQAGILRSTITDDVAIAEFLAGNAPFIVTGPWNLATIKESGIAYAIDPIPQAGPYASSPFIGVQGLVMSAHSRNPTAVREFLVDYVASQEGQTAIYRVGNRAPANSAAFEDAESDADTAAFVAAGAGGIPVPNSPAMDEVWAEWSQAETRIIDRSTDDAAGTWDDMVSSLQAELG
ncbi:maltose/maltodextrin ABC transporter substrate-binding protein MalE [Brooklawnia cerclae]|uniref:Arabinogalactan oligomer/maltooligosaccharide transport system substrate-binding protein n=1 Tax=Brooklawnia cerclae TaxID=349934 RepID=A0ABX0SL61_9ACTN|nr:extracellular solute-binding protein [Brooklawnia cerclae]NIH57472.1 arabinogalactan oligomer/maltooligosaccharide transport system substrate-binding protein [Brooklawnia cerclae]